MNINIRSPKYELTAEDAALIEKKLSAPLKLLEQASETALLEIEVEHAPPEGRSSEPYRLVANLRANGKMYHAEAVKPSPESAADRVRSLLEAEIRHSRGRTRRLMKRGAETFKRIMRFGRE
jgi:ribosome-associated translation inhibitor RaiA